LGRSNTTKLGAIYGLRKEQEAAASIAKSFKKRTRGGLLSTQGRRAGYYQLLWSTEEDAHRRGTKFQVNEPEASSASRVKKKNVEEERSAEEETHCGS